jgi:hypothetical protein
MNSHIPLLSLDPSADDVSYATVLHGVKFGSKAAAEQCAAALDKARRHRGERRQAASVVKKANGEE